MRARLMLPLGCALALASAAPAAVGSPPCELAQSTRDWMQSAVAGWSKIRSDLLKLSPGPLPWMIFFDQNCVWNVAADTAKLPANTRRLAQGLTYNGARVGIQALDHDGKLRLPDGRTIPVGRTIFTAPRPNSDSGYFIIALPDIWRAEWKPSDPSLEEFFLGVAAHELTHTTQIDTVLSRIKALKTKAVLPADVSDDILENMFKPNAAYRSLFERERDLFFDAAAQADDDQARATTRQALALYDERHQRFLTGKRRPLREIDGLFLNMEGLAGWVQYEMARRHPAQFSWESEIVATRGRSTAWVQGEGLAMTLLVARFVPNWQKRMLPPEMASPAALLKNALDAR